MSEPKCLATRAVIASRSRGDDLGGALLPAEDAVGEGAVEAGRGEGGEDGVEVDLAGAHRGVLVHAHRGAGRVDDVAQAAGRGVVEGVGEVDVGDPGTGARR